MREKKDRLVCKKCGKVWAFKTLEGFTQTMPLQPPFCECDIIE